MKSGPRRAQALLTPGYRGISQRISRLLTSLPSLSSGCERATPGGAALSLRQRPASLQRPAADRFCWHITAALAATASLDDGYCSRCGHGPSQSSWRVMNGSGQTRQSSIEDTLIDLRGTATKRCLGPVCRGATFSGTVDAIIEIERIAVDRIRVSISVLSGGTPPC
jgi:hypothetical protein